MIELLIIIFVIECFSFFKECPHPDEKQRTDLSRKLGLANKQVKFWFQNRRTQMKVKFEYIHAHVCSLLMRLILGTDL